MAEIKSHPFYERGPIIDQKAIDKTDSRRRMAKALLESSEGPQRIGHWTQGAAQLAKAGVGAYLENKSNEEQAAREDQYNADRLAFLKKTGSMEWLK
tara:strand:+ start:1069 stop:1359 length:291 start_codon:yes stop_codon:yes gene_type:complete